MTRLKHLDPQAAGPGIAARPPDDAVLEGSPEFTSWPCAEGAIDSGIWAATPGLHRMARDQSTVEQFYILEGEIELTEDGAAPRRFGPQDLVVIEPGFRGTWRTITPVRKLYFTARV